MSYTLMQEVFLRVDIGGEVQTTKMLYCPTTGKPGPQPDTATAWRERYRSAWLFDPWTGEARAACRIEHDPDGWLLVPPGETPTGEWDRYLCDVFRADGAFGQFKRFGWSGKCDTRLNVKLCKGEQVLTFRLTDPSDEERYYQLLHAEAWEFSLR